jgi:ribosome-associated heat shock protein Hsp15
MDQPTSVRIDKWLWAVRLFKTRSLATEACRSGHVAIAGAKVKPSHEVRVNQTIVLVMDGMTRTTRVVGLLDKRVGAKLVPQYAEDLTPPAEYERKREQQAHAFIQRPKGSGRPTKKDRRILERFF